MDTKKCNACKAEKPAKDFYVEKRIKCGLSGWCKICSRARRAAYRAANRLKVKRQSDQSRRRHMDTHQKATKKYKDKYKDRVAACGKVAYAIKKKVFIRPDICENCKKPARTQAHHEDYSKPLNVMWLCSSCHKYIHQTGPPGVAIHKGKARWEEAFGTEEELLAITALQQQNPP